MKEIGGYLEFEHYKGTMLHEGGVLLNSGKNCLRFLLREREIRKILVPYYLCDSVSDGCALEGVRVRYYHTDRDFYPVDLIPDDDEWIYLVNYYGQLADSYISAFYNKYQRVILDDVQAYFHVPQVQIDTIYSCRKFFGLSDGGILRTDVSSRYSYPQDESFERMKFLMGRFERSGSEFYGDYSRNEENTGTAAVKRMSLFTENLLHSFDYQRVEKTRTENFRFLHEHLKGFNQLELTVPKGAFAYPLLLEYGPAVRKQLIDKKIYIPQLWPNVLRDTEKTWEEHQMSENILPLPCDQRYDISDMRYMVQEIVKTLKGVSICQK